MEENHFIELQKRFIWYSELVTFTQSNSFRSHKLFSKLHSVVTNINVVHIQLFAQHSLVTPWCAQTFYSLRKKTITNFTWESAWRLTGITIVSPKCFTEFSEFRNKKFSKIFVITVKGLEPITSCERDQDATTSIARH